MPITYEEYMQQLGESPKQQKKPKKITYEEYMKQLDSQVVDTQVPEIKAAPQKAIKSSPLTTFALGVSKPLQEFNLNLAKAIESYGNLGINLANRLNPVSKYVAQNILKLDTSPETPELKPVTLTPATEYYQNQLQTVEQRLQQAPADTAHKIAAGAGQFVGNAISDIPMILTGGATAEAAIAKYLPNFAKMAPEAQQFVKAIMAAPGYTTSKKAIMEHRLPTAQEYAEDAAMFGAFDLGGQVLGKVFKNLKGAKEATQKTTETISPEVKQEQTVSETIQPEIKKVADSEPILELLLKKREAKGIVRGGVSQGKGKEAEIVTSKTAAFEVQQPAGKTVKPGFKQTEVEIIKKAGFDDSAEAHLALEAAKNGKEWFAKEFPGLPETAYQEMVNKAKTIPKGIQFNIQYFAKNNPEAVQAAKDKLISQFRTNTIERAVAIPPEVKENLKPEEFDYIPQTSKEWQEKAMKNVTENQEKVMEEIRNTEALSGGVQAHEAAIITQKLTEEAKRTGDYLKLLDWTKMVAQKTRETARALKGTDTAWEKTKSPEGALTKAQRVVDNARDMIKQFKIKGPEPELTDEDVKFIIDAMEQAQKFPEGSYEQQAEIAKVKQRIVSKLPVTLGEKISTYQTIAQLLNPKTWLRNIGGNLVFGLSEKLSDVAGAALDKAISIYSGKRTKLMPDIVTEAKGFFRGAKETWQDFRSGIDTSPSTTQFDLPRKQVFKKGPFSQAEKVTSLGLKMGDNPFYQSAYDSALKEQMKIAGSKVATEDMIKQAHEVARYRTFQDFNAISNLFSTLKHTLNFKKGKLAGTGFGDLVLKYPKTPANLLARAIDYSPAGYLNSLNQLYKGLQGEFNQRKFVDSLSRATVGTGMFLAGITLYNLGIVTGKSDQDKDVNILQQATGLGQYKINLSALKRFLTTFDPKAAKLQPGDKFMSYDWILPMAIPVTMGVNLSAAYQRHKRVRALDVIGSVVTAIEGGVSALAEQPVVKGLADLFRGYNSQDIVNNLIETAASAPSSFIPTLMNQIRQITDNVKRNVQGENAVETGINLVKNKIPGLSKTLPARIDTLGQTQTVYQDNSLFNVLLNPAYTSEFKSNPAVKLILDLYDKTGEKTHFPRVAPKAFSFNGQKYELTQQEQVKLQEYMGKMTTEEFTKLAKNPRFMRLKDELKVKVLKSYLDVISDRAKIQLLKDKGVIKAR